MKAMECAGCTDVGRVRVQNEDAFFVADDCGVCAVADGMGGHDRGEVASALAVQVFKKRFGAGAAPQASAGGLRDVLGTAIREANRTILERTGDVASVQGMGTTIVAAGCAEGRLVTANVGDSRAYLFRGGTLAQLTKDHSFVWELYEQGVIAYEDMYSHPHRNMVTRALGSTAEVEVDFTEQACGEGDIVLLCSDGLSEMLRDERIAEIIASHGDDLEAVSAALVAAANEAGGSDNITVVLMRVC